MPSLRRALACSPLAVTLGLRVILCCSAGATGKTLLAQTLAKFVGVPFAMADATTLTQVIHEPQH